MAALHTEQLEFLLTHLAQHDKTENRTVSLGVFPANLIPSLQDLQLRTYDVCFIVNTDPHDQPGKHWLAFYYDSKNRVLEYFDSFGFPLKLYGTVKSTLSVRKLKIVDINSRNCLQAAESSVCGYYCVLYLHWRMKSKSALSKLEKLGKTPSQRDEKAVDRLHKLMHEHKCSRLPNVFTQASQSSCPLSTAMRKK